MGWLLLLGLLSFVGLMISVAVISEIHLDFKRNYGYEMDDSFHVKCPVCTNNTYWCESATNKLFVTHPISYIIRLSFKCSTCDADLVGLYLQHPFIKDRLAKIEALKQSAEFGMEYAKSVAEIQDATRIKIG